MSDPASYLVPLRAMFAELSEAALTELEQALAISLIPVVTAGERRQAELGPLAELLRAAAPADTSKGATLLRISRDEYDASRPDGAPASAALVKRFGGWKDAVGSAAGLLGWECGRRPWANSFRGRRRPPRLL